LRAEKPTDEELIKRLLETGRPSSIKAADRIEALVRELGLADDQRREWERHCKDAEARLAKAVDALTRIASAQPRPMRSGGYEGHDVSNMQRTARTALAEIGGEK
jgi:hypothetical protein